MKKIGIIHGMEDSFPTAFIDRINSKNIPGIVAERVTIDKVIQGEACGFDVLLDRISHDAPFYRSDNSLLIGSATRMVVAGEVYLKWIIWKSSSLNMQKPVMM